MKGLQQMKDLLLPALWGRDPDGRSDLIVNFKNDSLDIQVNSHRETLLTRHEIENETWRGSDSVLKDRIDSAFRKGAS